MAIPPPERVHTEDFICDQVERAIDERANNGRLQFNIDVPRELSDDEIEEVTNRYRAAGWADLRMEDVSVRTLPPHTTYRVTLVAPPA